MLVETDDGSTSGALFAAVFFDPTAEGTADNTSDDRNRRHKRPS